MDDLLNRLIEVDKAARAMVKSANDANTAVLKEVEQRKKTLKAENEEKLTAKLRSEREKQDAALQKVKTTIETRTAQLIDRFDSMYAQKGDEWVEKIVNNVISTNY